MKVRAHVETLDLPPDARCRLHLDLDPRTRFGALRDLNGVQVQVGGRSGESFHGDAPHGDLLHELLVVGVQRVESVHLRVIDLVRGRVPEQHQCVEPGQRFQRLGCADLLRLVDDHDRAVGADDIDRAAGLEVIEFVVDAPVVLAGGVEGLDVDDHHLHPGIGAEPLQLVQLGRVVHERTRFGAIELLEVLGGHVE